MEPAKLITDLRKAGWTQAAIGSAIGLSQNCVSDVERGRTKTMKLAAGQKLLELHGKIVGRKRSNNRRSMSI